MDIDRERFQQIDRILETALELEPEARAAFLAQAGAGDTELRRQVEQLLGYAEEDPALDLPAVAHLLAGAEADFTGQQFGRFQLEERIGEGGMGEVWQATDTELGRKVAVKLLPPEFAANPERVRRFEQEARTVSRLNHPNIITLYDIGQSGALHFFVTELIAGETLRARLQRSKPDWDMALALALQLAEALAAAHEAGVIHRDIKPENVMVQPGEHVKVLDFGIARLVEDKVGGEEALNIAAPPDSTRLTEAGALLGTASYMSPEQVRGEEVDQRTDLYSFGVVLYELLTGVALVAGASLTEIRQAILYAEPPLLELHAPSLPADFQRILKRLLSKERAARYQTARELHGELQALQKRLASSAPKPGRNALLALAAVLLLILFGSILLFRSGLSKQEPAAPEPSIHRLATRNPVEEVSVSPAGRHLAYTTFQGRTRRLWLQNGEWDKRHPIVHSEVELVPPSVGHDCLFPRFAPDESGIYYVAEDRSRHLNVLYWVAVSGGAPRRIIEDLAGAAVPSPDGRQLAFVRARNNQRDWSLLVCNAEGGALRQIAERHSPVRIAKDGAAWSPDGRRLAFAAGSESKNPTYEIYQVPAAGGAESLLSAQRLRLIEQVEWLRDDSGLLLLAAHPGDNPHHLWYLSFAGDRLRRLTAPPYNNNSLTVMAAGQAVFAIQQDEIRSLWAAPSRNPDRARQLISGTAAGEYGITWTEDNRILYAGGRVPHNNSG